MKIEHQNKQARDVMGKLITHICGTEEPCLHGHSPFLLFAEYSPVQGPVSNCCSKKFRAQSWANPLQFQARQGLDFARPPFLYL